METKALHAVNYKANGDGERVRTGIAAVFGNIDSGGDITHPGAFIKTISEGRARYKHLWNHNGSLGPIASIKELREVSRDELPDEIRKLSPDATGGLLVKREYYPKAINDLSEAILYAIDQGDIDEMSYAYNPIKFDDTKADGVNVRNLREVALFDTSDVLQGMNASTLGNIAKSYFQTLPLGMILQQLKFYVEAEKAGRRNNNTDQILINTLHDIAIDLGCNSCKPLEANPPKSDEAEAAVKSTSLDLLKLKTETLRLRAASI